ERLVASVDGEHPLTAVLHAAGVLDDSTVGGMSAAQVETVLRPKVDAAWHLHEATRGTDLAAFVMFSSVVGTLGGPGQANYAAANTFLDALAHRRRSEGLPATSVAWGLWAEASGMTGHMSEADRARFGSAGVRAMATAPALAMLDAALPSGLAAPVAAVLDGDALRRQAADGMLNPLLRDLVRVPLRTAAGVDRSSALRRQLAGVAGVERDGVLLDVVRSHAAAVLGASSPDAVDVDRPFKELGFDSLAGVQFRNRLAVATGLRLPTTLVFDSPTPAAVMAFLRGVLDGDGDAPARAAASAPAVVRGADAWDDEPIAIVGLGCRYPGGVVSPEGLWDLAADGVDAVSSFPVNRGWDRGRLLGGGPGSSITGEGGFLHDADRFDAGFFRISPREALVMDPQQRLLLEVAWEALERAGVVPGSLAGSTGVGVFVGATAQHYGPRMDTAAGGAEGYVLTGSSTSVASGRIAYALGVRGPALTVDTACSSSLVALHLGVRALRSGECSLVLAGGAAVMSSPGLFVEFTRQGGLAVDGRVKAFASAADGTAWGEGVGLCVLERLSDAKARGHKVWAVIRGSAVNQDGASNGLTAPSGPSQREVIGAALADAGLSAADVDVVEAHGTGTRLGDPIEAQALLATYGRAADRVHPLLLGSVKSNIGHTQAAAGVAGVIKMVMALQHGRVPATLHVDAPSEHVDWDAGAVELATEQVDWPETGRSRRAAVSAFGISGTNAHVVLEQAPQEEAASDAGAAEPGRFDARMPWVVSGASEDGLRAQAVRLRDLAESAAEAELGCVGVALSGGREQLPFRAVVRAEDRDVLVRGLEAVAAGEQAAGVTTGTAASGRLAVVFPGQGSQFAGMGRELHARFPAFAGAFDEVCAAFDGLLERPLKEVLFADVAESVVDRTEFTQPGLFAVEVALFRLLESLGVVPEFVAGHSVGGVVAAHCAGVWSLADAAAVIAARGRLMGGLPADGGMLQVSAGVEAVERFVGPGVEVAAVNSPVATVLTGDGAELDRVSAELAESGVRSRRLVVSGAFHSAHTEGLLEQFAEVLRSVRFHAPNIAVVSDLTGELATTDELGSVDYWTEHVRRPVRYEQVTRTLLAQQVSTFVEAGPNAALTRLTEQTLPADTDAAVVPLLDPRPYRDTTTPQTDALLDGLARVHVTSRTVDWGVLHPATPETVRHAVHHTDLPTYAFQHRSYWITDTTAPTPNTATTGHPLLGSAVELAVRDSVVFTARLSVASQPWLADHAVAGAVLLPGTGFLDAVLRAGQYVGAPHVEELALASPLVIPQGAEVDLRVTVEEPDDGGRRAVSVHSRAADAAERSAWTRHATATLTAEPSRVPEPVTAWPPASAVRGETPDAVYARLDEQGYAYGPSFRGLTAFWRDGADLCAEAADPGELETGGFGVHPALLDATMHPLAMAVADDGVALPFTWSGVTLHATRPPTALRTHLRGKEGSDAVEVVVTDGEGSLVLTAEALVLRHMAAGELADGAPGTDDLLQVQWRPLTALEPDSGATLTGPAAVVGPSGPATLGLPGGTPAYPDL
ncbi:MAG: acyltransferase domain-containing protein, partial [Streptomyces sp.]|nr:acyltransferase domain-containing protein [Streptomyces sp.]